MDENIKKELVEQLKNEIMPDSNILKNEKAMDKVVEYFDCTRDLGGKK